MTRVVSGVLCALAFGALGAGCGDKDEGTPSGSVEAGAAGETSSGGEAGADSASAGGEAGAAGEGGVAGDSGAAGEAGEAGSGGMAGVGGMSGTGGMGGVGGTAGGPVMLGPGDKLDLLFVIDDSISMGDKQQILDSAAPELLDRVINPDCVRAGEPPLTGPGVGQACPAGYAREFRPFEDVHVGVITSSLGAHGGRLCGPNDPLRESNDRARLLPSVRPGLTSYEGLGFLAWDPNGEKNPPGENDASTFTAQFRETLLSAGNQGCGYEAPLEAFYRFLIDPEPHADVMTENNQAMKSGLDEVLLGQRAAFLRPDSVVAIVILSDENDCSVVDGGINWLVSESDLTMPRSTSQCKTNPNDPCCRPCARLVETPEIIAACGPRAEDPECQINSGLLTPSTSATLPEDGSVDHANLRCFQQKSRFGVDFLYPISRYVSGLKDGAVPSRAGDLVQNPLYAGNQRDPSRVIVAAIAGVPWQDVATPETLAGPGLEYMTAEELRGASPNRWDVILGPPGEAPLDPLMIESVLPRTGENPIVNAPLVAPASQDPRANPINGHEYQVVDWGDLQYACIFPLLTPTVCDFASSTYCDCYSPDVPANKPLCNPPLGGPAETTQYFAKAYPGRRILEVLRGYGDNSVVASICPKLASGDTSNPAFGYNPAMRAVLRRIAAVVGGP